MDAIQRLKFAYMSGAADAGKTYAETKEQLVKQANGESSSMNWTLDPVGTATSVGKSIAGYAPAAYMAALTAITAGGGWAGYSARNMTAKPQLSPEELKAQELAQTYRTFSNRVKQRRKLTDLRMGNIDKLKEKESNDDFLPLF